MDQHGRKPLKKAVGLLVILFIGVAVGYFAAGGFATKALTADEREHGYALLYQLMADEADVDKLLIIKSPAEPLPALLKNIAATAAAVVKEMNAWEAADPSLNLTDTGLPKVEVQTRSSIADMRTEQLLLHGGTYFENVLIETQASATNYAWHLAKVLARDEPDPARAQALAQWRDQWEALSEQISAIIGFIPETQEAASASETTPPPPIPHRHR